MSTGSALEEKQGEEADVELETQLRETLDFTPFEKGFCAIHIQELSELLELRTDVPVEKLCARLAFIARVGLRNARLVADALPWFSTRINGQNTDVYDQRARRV